jgi:large subunit ribosomal protein L25
MQTYAMNAKSRALTGRKTDHLRAEGTVPAVVYGAIEKPRSVEVDRNEFVRVFKAAGESGVVELTIDGKDKLNVLVHDIQTDPLRDEVIHADFRALDMNKPIETDVKVVFTGESAAVKHLGGIFVHPLESIMVRALPKDLPHEIMVDISALATFDDVIRVSDIAALPGVELLEELEATVATVDAPRSEEELAELDKAVEMDVNAIEVEKKGKEEEEGAAPAAGEEKAEGKE